MAPENTIPAFEFAMAHRADVLEIDVRLSRDGKVIVTHDETIDRTTNGNGKVRSHDLIGLKKLDAGYRFQLDGKKLWKSKGVVLLTLEELFEAFPAAGVNIDVKDNDPAAVAAVVSVIEKLGVLERSVIASFHDQNLEFCRTNFAGVRTSAGKSDVKRFYWRYLLRHKKNILSGSQLLQLPPRYYFVNLSSSRFINAVHSAGGEVNYWTINEPAAMKKLLALGADGIVTDRADLAAGVLENFKPGLQ
ncbi:hypothetical protein AB833_03840 [Chromatiales bacterium (ex Bugula neritina AB1)]|nr:hypothetical protein AB833_03840 [Chromatiales bacterium (ex Bugula neritina AB1)]